MKHWNVVRMKTLNSQVAFLLLVKHSSAFSQVCPSLFMLFSFHWKTGERNTLTKNQWVWYLDAGLFILAESFESFIMRGNASPRGFPSTHRTAAVSDCIHMHLFRNKSMDAHSQTQTLSTYHHETSPESVPCSEQKNFADIIQALYTGNTFICNRL